MWKCLINHTDPSSLLYSRVLVGTAKLFLFGFCSSFAFSCSINCSKINFGLKFGGKVFEHLLLSSEYSYRDSTNFDFSMLQLSFVFFSTKHSSISGKWQSMFWSNSLLNKLLWNLKRVSKLSNITEWMGKRKKER